MKLLSQRSRPIATLGVALTALLTVSSVANLGADPTIASSHREAPIISEDASKRILKVDFMLCPFVDPAPKLCFFRNCRQCLIGQEPSRQRLSLLCAADSKDLWQERHNRVMARYGPASRLLASLGSCPISIHRTGDTG